MDRIMKRADNPSSLQEAQTEPSSKQQQQQATLRSYLSTSTIHGLSKLGESTHWSLRLLWGVIIFALLLLSVFNIYELTVEFLQFQTYYSIQDHSNSTAKFPSVTICNANNYQKSKVNSLVENVDERFQDLLDQGLRNNVVNDWSLVPRAVEFLSHNNYTLAKATESASKSLFLDALEGWCKFGISKACSRFDFVDFMKNVNSGFCKTFNPNGTFNQAIAGPLGGLTLTLYLNQEDYMRLVPIDGGAGALLTVHPQDVFPGFGDTWFAIQPGTQTRISIEQKITFRKQKPYKSKCVNWDGDIIYPGRYHTSNCRESCLQLKLYESCGFIDNRVGEFLKLTGKKLSLQQKSLSKDPFNCSHEFYENVSVEKNCDCPLPCWEESFVLSSSSSRWPSEVDMQYYRPVLSKVLNRTDVASDFIYANFLQLKIFFKTLGYQEVREVANMSPSSFTAGIGGSLGLFVGASFFSVLEFVGFVITVCFGHRHRRIVNAGEV